MAAAIRVIYVDDEPTLLEIGKIFLEQSGDFSVVSVESAPAALALLKREQFDAIVSDYEMPGMNGIEFLSEVRTCIGKIPFIIFTGKGGKEEVIQAINKGADNYLQKGGDPDLMFADLSHKIRQAVSGRRADEALRETNEYLNSLFNYANAPIIVWDPGFVITRFNRAFENLTSRSEQEVIGQSLDILFPKESRDRSLSQIKKTLEGERWETVEIPILIKDGSVRTILWNSANILTPDSTTVLATIAQGQDITERKVAEQEIVFKNILLSTQQETSLDGILIVDEIGKILNYNQRFIDMWDIPGDIISSRSDERAVQYVIEKVADPEIFLDRINYLYNHKAEKSHEEILLKDGRILDRYSAPMSGKAGTYYGRVWYFRDITGRKVAEEALQTLTRELESRVLQRTAELEQEIVHRKAAEETITASLNEKEILLREIHHRVKNNLQIITSLIRLQNRQITDPGTMHALLDSESRIRSMALVHEKLYRSTDLANIDFTDYIRSLTTSLITAYATDPHRIRLVIDVKDVSLDINRAIPVGLIMNELVANALKHAFPEGWSGEITIKGRRTPAGITLSVQDNGVGLPEGLDWRNTSTLGLHLIITLIQQVHGSIELNSTGGTSFEMFIPSATKETSS